VHSGVIGEPSPDSHHVHKGRGSRMRLIISSCNRVLTTFLASDRSIANGFSAAGEPAGQTCQAHQRHRSRPGHVELHIEKYWSADSLPVVLAVNPTRAVESAKASEQVGGDVGRRVEDLTSHRVEKGLCEEHSVEADGHVDRVPRDQADVPVNSEPAPTLPLRKKPVLEVLGVQLQRDGPAVGDAAVPERTAAHRVHAGRAVLEYEGRAATAREHGTDVEAPGR